MKIKKSLFIGFLVAVLILTVGCTGSASISSSSGGDLPAPRPEIGSTITITNCAGDPAILQVNEGTEVTFVNSDSQDHIIFIESQEINLPAQDGAKFTARSPVGTQYTTNYNCDQQYGGAIFIA